ncbi:MAG: flavodoxin family protein [Clostridiaceae bacterium]
MRNILIVVGSGIQNGNTDNLAEAYIKGAKEVGHNIQKVFLGNQKVHGCIGCGACQLNEHVCAIRDDMQPIYSLFEKCDTIVFASPLYFWTISAHLKAFIDRLYAISTNDEYPHKDTVLLMTGGSEKFYAFEQAVSFYRFFTKALGWTDQGMCLAGGCEGEPGKRNIDNKYLEEAYELGKKHNIA